MHLLHVYRVIHVKPEVKRLHNNINIQLSIQSISWHTGLPNPTFPKGKNVFCSTDLGHPLNEVLCETVSMIGPVLYKSAEFDFELEDIGEMMSHTRNALLRSWIGVIQF